VLNAGATPLPRIRFVALAGDAALDQLAPGKAPAAIR
jgi:hypothetical protein